VTGGACKLLLGKLPGGPGQAWDPIFVRSFELGSGSFFSGAIIGNSCGICGGPGGVGGKKKKRAPVCSINCFMGEITRISRGRGIAESGARMVVPVEKRAGLSLRAFRFQPGFLLGIVRGGRDGFRATSAVESRGQAGSGPGGEYGTTRRDGASNFAWGLCFL